MKFAVIDVETTGGSPKSSKITEVAIYVTDGITVLEEFTSLVNPEMKIPIFIEKLTGISNKMVADAPKFYEIAKKIIEITEDCVFVAHNVGFDYGMFRHEFKLLGFDFRRKQLCTVRASRYMLPGLPSYSLGKLSKSLGIVLEGRHRAAGDAKATTIIFQQLFTKNQEALLGFLQEEINPSVLHPNLDLETLEEIPSKPGVYQFYNETNQLIYIGKSTKIKNRVEQHLKNVKTQRAAKMRYEISRIEYELTGSELIALLYESELIKQYKPIYNRQLRKTSFPFGIFSIEDKWGYKQLKIARITQTEEIPITSFSTQKEAVKYLENVCEKFELCQKLCGLYTSEKACFSYQVKQCNGACIQEENVEVYNARVDNFIDYLSYENDSFFIIENGRNKFEKGIVLIENGIYRGFGYIPFRALKSPKSKWKNYIDLRMDTRDNQTILNHYLRKNDKENIVTL
jgi:DNA polymerase III subunit epsilon